MGDMFEDILDVPPPPYTSENNNNKGDPMNCEDADDYVVVPDIAGAEKHKAEGNALYKQKEYKKALEKYSEAHRLHPTSHIYLGNRAAVCLALENYTDALWDSREACRLDNTYVKGYSRQIKCNIALGQVAAARAVLKSASQFTEDSIEDTFRHEITQLNCIEEMTESGRKAEQKQDYRTAYYYYKKASEIAVGCSSLKLLAAENMALHGPARRAGTRHQYFTKEQQGCLRHLRTRTVLLFGRYDGKGF